MFFESIIIALEALIANKLRLTLTMVGIVIGVGTVIVMVSLSTALKLQTEDFYSSLGKNSIKVYGYSNIPGVKSKVSFSDANVIARQISGVKLVVPEGSYAASVDYNNKNWSKTAVGTLPEYFEAHNMTLKYGRFIADTDISNKNKVVVLGTEPVKFLFKIRGDGSVVSFHALQ